MRVPVGVFEGGCKTGGLGRLELIPQELNEVRKNWLHVVDYAMKFYLI